MAQTRVLAGGLGVCLGFLLMTRIYIYNTERSTPSLNSGDWNRHLAKESTSSRKVLRTGKPKNELHRVLQRVAPQGEVMIVISNMNLIHQKSLVYWLEAVEKIKSKNWIVVAIDEELKNYCKQHNIQHYYRPVVIPKSQEKTGANHAISSMKYEILEEFLQLGWNVLLSDVDIVTVQDPMDFLYRDSDVEGMSDGYDDGTAYGAIYGVDDASMGWSRYAQGTQHMALNSGLFYLRANERTIALMQNIYKRLRKEKLWDQSVYNEEIFFLTHGPVKRAQVSVRVMEIEKFMNSKVLFKRIRNMPRDQQPLPVMVHMNYHPDKTERMEAAIRYYLKGDHEALKPFPGGSEPGT